MKTSQVVGMMLGATLLSGVACAEPERPQGPRFRGEEPELRREGPRREGLEERERAALREGRGPRGPGQEGGFRPEGRRPGEGGQGAGPGVGRGGPMLGRGPQEIPGPERLKEIGATEQQIEALAKLNDAQQLKRVDLQAAVEKAELSLRQVMQADGADEKAAHQAVDALSQARAELMKQEISSRLKAKEVLGADLVKKLRELGPPKGPGRPGRPEEGPRPGAE